MVNNPNPLDRIRSLAPADMTNDELGVAVLIGAGNPLNERRRSSPPFIGDTWYTLHHKGYEPSQWASTERVSLHTNAIYWGSFTNPALDFNALLKIVREWVATSQRKLIRLIETFVEMFTDEWRPDGVESMLYDENEQDLDCTHTTAWCFLQYGPRQLAEAFVTAAREVEP